jgi:hypothetical protein
MNLNLKQMNTINFKTFAAGILVCLAMVACVQDDDFSVPSSVGSEENERLNDLMDSINSGHISLLEISELKSMYNTNTRSPRRIEQNIAIKGYVSSTDIEGNFYREFFLQDKYENPTTAIKISLDQVDVYNRFNKGREVYINLNPKFEINSPTGLYIGEEQTYDDLSIITIGGGIETDLYGSTVTRLNENQINASLLRSNNTEELTPLVIEFSEITDDQLLGIYVQIDNVEFVDVGERFFNPANTYDTQRSMLSCVETFSGFEYPLFQLETSSFSNFKNDFLPTGNGSIMGIINKTYNASSRVLVLNSIDDVDMNGSRCGPSLFETFNSAVDDTNLDIANWTNYAEVGSELWTEQVFGGNGYAEFTAYQTGESSNIGWLISPGIDMDAQDGEVLNFQTEYAYPDTGHYPLEVFVSTDFNGEESGITTATWEPLTNVFSAHPDVTSQWYSWVDSGTVDLSSYTGTLYVAFKYTGSDTSNQNSTIHIENVIVSVP